MKFFPQCTVRYFPSDINNVFRILTRRILHQFLHIFVRHVCRSGRRHLSLRCKHSRSQDHVTCWPMKIKPLVNSSIAGNRSMNCWPVNSTVMHRLCFCLVNSQNIVFLLYCFYIGEKMKVYNKTKISIISEISFIYWPLQGPLFKGPANSVWYQMKDPVMLYISCSNTCNSLQGPMLRLNLGQRQLTLKKNIFFKVR